MEEVTKIFFVVQQELQEQSKQINSRLQKQKIIIKNY